MSALAGLRVLDLSTVLAGPNCARYLADFGADVIKVEAPGGDSTRVTGPALEPGMAATFIGANRSKRSIVLDLKNPAGRDALLALAEQADVLISSVRPQKLALLGLDPAALMSRNDRLIVISVTGFGEGGPYAGRPAYDDIIQGLCGLASLAEEGAEPRYMPTVIADKTCGLYAAIATLAALTHRARTGEANSNPATASCTPACSRPPVSKTARSAAMPGASAPMSSRPSTAAPPSVAISSASRARRAAGP
jgi:crotonobetainyl-CoA:carnitine CoA-transferase CaiB-like acyl-CoA transferase